MRRHKYLKRLKQLRDALVDKYGGTGWGDMRESDFTNDTVWLIWLSLVKDIKECGLSPVFKIDGIRLYYYNELWKKVNNKDHEPLPKEGIVPRSHVTYKDMKFTDTMERAEWLAKQPLPSYMWTEAK